MNTDVSHAQTQEITTARTEIVKAFQAIQNAERHGALNADLQPLIQQLNQALELEENATLEQDTDPNRASRDALQSINISDNVSFQAQNLDSLAQTSTRNQSILSYTFAVLAAALSALVVMETHRVARFIRTRRLKRAKIRYEDGDTGK